MHFTSYCLTDKLISKITNNATVKVPILKTVQYTFASVNDKICQNGNGGLFKESVEGRWTRVVHVFYVILFTEFWIRLESLVDLIVS